MHYQMQEGYLTLGEGAWQDRTINMLAANHLPTKGANVVVTRETLPLGVSFADYLTNQKTELAKNLASFKLLADNEDFINETPAHFLEISWDNQGNPMRQMIFMINDIDNILNLTATVPGEIDEATRTALINVMKSFKTGPAPAAGTGAPKWMN